MTVTAELLRPEKFAARRDELAAAARDTLAELGYARTSLREIADRTEYSHGVLHYYFHDKVDLIAHSVRQVKAECMTRYDAIVAAATDGPSLAAAFGAAMAASLREDAPMHRLWYDLRNQSMFTRTFHDDVADIDAGLQRMIWRVVSRYAELTDATPPDPATAYAVFDGLFVQALLAFADDPDGACVRLAEQAEALLTRLCP
ncbi:MAG TPA: TetR/AcrR family transcriptional regulator [Sporichthyaceae bacterium]|nr:TetR/AcrR family transcriptional regulator [Sporichthyaceae bacterium]